MSVQNSRIEEDLLGKKEVDVDAYYGIQSLRAQENFFITGYSLDKELIYAIAYVKKAAALTNMEIGRLDAKRAKAIVAAADDILNGNLHDQFVVDPIQGGAGTSINMNANEVIANRALELIGEKKGNYSVIHPNNDVNMAQSTNDSIPTAIHIALLSLMTRLETTIEKLIESFDQKSEQFDHVIKMGRTHLQDAVPIRLGQQFSSYAQVLKRDLNRIRQLDASLFDVNLGATAVGTGLNADPKYTELVVQKLGDLTGYPLRNADNLIDATQNTDAYTEASSALKICMVNMSKVSNDLRLMASGPRAGLGEITLPARQPGSSIMPGKINPVICEVVNQVAFQIVGNDHTVTMASEAGQFELNVMEPVIAFNIIQSIRMMDRVLTTFRVSCIEGIEANEKKSSEDVEQSIGVITAISPHVGYEVASSLAKEAMQTGKPIRQIMLERDILSETAINLILDPFEMTKPGISGELVKNNS